MRWKFIEDRSLFVLKDIADTPYVKQNRKMSLEITPMKIAICAELILLFIWIVQCVVFIVIVRNSEVLLDLVIDNDRIGRI